jgi:hypothetical protein
MGAVGARRGGTMVADVPVPHVPARSSMTVSAVARVTDVVASVSSMASMASMAGVMAPVGAVPVLTNPTECHGDESNAAHGKRGQVYVHG